MFGKMMLHTHAHTHVMEAVMCVCVWGGEGEGETCLVTLLELTWSSSRYICTGALASNRILVASSYCYGIFIASQNCKRFLQVAHRNFPISVNYGQSGGGSCCCCCCCCSCFEFRVGFAVRTLRLCNCLMPMRASEFQYHILVHLPKPKPRNVHKAQNGRGRESYRGRESKKEMRTRR